MIKIIFFLLLLFVSFQNVNAIFRSGRPMTELPEVEKLHTALEAEKKYEEYTSGLQPYQARLKVMSLKNKKKSELELLRQLKNEIEQKKGANDSETQKLNSLIETKKELESIKTKFQFKKEGFSPQYALEEFIKSSRKQPDEINRSNILNDLQKETSTLKNLDKEYDFYRHKTGQYDEKERELMSELEEKINYGIETFLSNIETFIEEIKKQKIAGAERDNIYKTLMDLLLESKEYNLIDKFEESRWGVPLVRSKSISLAVELQKWKDEPTVKKPALNEYDKKVQDVIDELQYYTKVMSLKKQKDGHEQLEYIMSDIQFNPANKIRDLIADPNAIKANAQIKKNLNAVIEKFQDEGGFGTRRIADFYEPDNLADFITRRELPFEPNK